MFDFDSIVDGSFLRDRTEHKGPFAMKRPQPHAYAFEDDDAELGPTMDHSALAVDLTAVRPTQAIWESARAMPSCPVPAAIPKLPMKKGTTTLGFQFQGGVILAVDSRASMGQYIASSTVQKVLEIDDMLLGTMAGGAADCQYWERVLGQRCRLWELRNGEKITVAAASKILAGITYSMRNNGLSMGTMVAGWDKFGPSLYYVDDQGTRVKHTLFSVGSGSIYAYGVLDSGFRHDLTVEEACDLGRKAIFHATYRDGGSGAFVSVYHIHAKGWTKISRTDQSLLYNTYMAHAALAPPAE